MRTKLGMMTCGLYPKTACFLSRLFQLQQTHTCTLSSPVFEQVLLNDNPKFRYRTVAADHTCYL